MAGTPMYDPLTSEARSPWLAGLTEACNKLSNVLDMNVSEFIDLQLNEVFISKTDRYRIYQAPLGNKLWLQSPPPVIRKNGVVITPEKDNFTIDYLGGSIAFEIGSTLTENDFVTADATYIIDGSNSIENIIEQVNEVASSASNFRGYFATYEVMVSTLGVGATGQYAIVGGDSNSLYIWNSSSKKWENTFKPTDLSDYYKRLEVDGLLTTREPFIEPNGSMAASDNFYYGGRKTWQNLYEKVRDVSLDGLVTTNKEKITESDSVLSAFGKIQSQINDYVHDLFGTGTPTDSTEATIGQDYTNTSNGNKYHLISIDDGTYNWAQYQDSLILDNRPIENSENYLTSGTIFEALQEKTDKVIPSKIGNLATLDEEGNLTDSGKGVDDVGRKPIPTTATLTVTGWTGTSAPFIQTVSVQGVSSDKENQIVHVAPNPVEDNIKASSKSEVYCTEQGDGTLTFSAFKSKPSISLSYNISIQDI